MIYRHIASSERAFVQQLAVAYVSNGYWYYVTGCIPEYKDVLRIDEKLLAKYHVAISKWARARRKQQGLANVQYLRHHRFFIIIATRGLHRFFDEEGKCVKDIRREPVHFAGYSISYRRGIDRKWHASVRIHPVEYNQLKNHLVDMATCRSVQSMCREFQRIPFEPYAPVRRQLLNILRAANRVRRRSGYESVPVAAIRMGRRPVKVFEISHALTEKSLGSLQPFNPRTHHRLMKRSQKALIKSPKTPQSSTGSTDGGGAVHAPSIDNAGAIVILPAS
jgi:hypothetical protein